MGDALDKVVLVTCDGRPKDHGTGFVLVAAGADGARGARVVTCGHVVRDLLRIVPGAEIAATRGLMVAGRPATVVVDLTDVGVDLAILDVPGLAAGAVDWGPGADGEDIEVIGFERAGLAPVASGQRGHLVARSATALGGTNRPAWRFELVKGGILPGHSGSPVFRAGTSHVVAVVTMGSPRLDGNDGVAVAIENLELWPERPPPTARPTTITAPATDPARTQGRITLRGVPKGADVVIELGQAIGDDLQDITVTVTRGSVVLTLDGPRDRVLAICERVIAAREHPLFKGELIAVELLDGLVWRSLWQGPLALDPRHMLRSSGPRGPRRPGDRAITGPGPTGYAGPPEHDASPGGRSRLPRYLAIAAVLVGAAIVLALVLRQHTPSGTSPIDAAIAAPVDAPIVDAAIVDAPIDAPSDAPIVAPPPPPPPTPPCTAMRGRHCVTCVLEVDETALFPFMHPAMRCPAMRPRTKHEVVAKLRVKSTGNAKRPDGCKDSFGWGYYLGDQGDDRWMQLGEPLRVETTVESDAKGTVVVPFKMGRCQHCGDTSCDVVGTITVTGR